MPEGKIDRRASPPALLCVDGKAARELRRLLGMNQIEFWLRLGITQSGGSRYESGRQIPEQVLWVLHITYGTEKQASQMLEWMRDLTISTY